MPAYPNLLVESAMILIYSVGKRRRPSKFCCIIDGTARSLPPVRARNGVPCRNYVVCSCYSFCLSEKAEITMGLSSAGFDTTSSTLMWWTLAMVVFPEVQHRAQAEIDAVVGRARPPTFADAPQLPYVRAIIKEVLRWRPVIERGLPHKAAEDDWYEGMFIPKGATCMANTWHCNHDRTIFGDDADDFRPERHLNAKGDEVLPGPRETNGEGHVTYGFGRRICVGKYFANDSLFINAVMILWAAKLECARDENGKKLPPDPNAFVDNGIMTLVLSSMDEFLGCR